MKKEIGIFRKLKELFKKEKNNKEENNYDKSESVWSMISRQIDELEDKVREIECLEQKELAKQYSNRVNNLREQYREKAISEENTFTNHDFDEILNELSALKYELDEYLNGEGIIIDNKLTNERYNRKLKKIATESSEKSTEELWAETRKILEDMKKKCEKNSHLEFENLKKLIAKQVLRILRIQAKRGEELDFIQAEEFCTRQELIDAMKDKLNEMAENEKNEEKRKELRNTAENLDVNSLQDSKVWMMLIGVQSKESGEEEKNSPELTVYTLGDIDEKTGEWINVRKEYDIFPKDFGDENDRVLQIEINGVSEIEGDKNYDIYSRYNAKNGFSEYLKLKSVIIGESVKSIGTGAFKDCKELESIEIGENVEEIGEGAFGYSGLKQIIIPNIVKNIGDNAFYCCWNLENVKIGENVEKIGKEAFSNCTRLNDVNIGKGVKEIEEYCFVASGIVKMNIPDNVKIIKEGAFSYCENLMMVEIGKGVNCIEKWCFMCSGIRKMNIPDNVKIIKEGAFELCRNLRTVNIGKGVKEIGKGCFNNASSLVKIDLPDNVEELGTNIFYCCTSLKNVKIGKGVKRIADWCFANSGIEIIEIPDNVKIIGNCAFRCCRSLKNVNIGKGVTEIQCYCFDNASSLESIKIPDNVEQIGQCAFEYCRNLKSLEIGKGVKRVERGCFSGCGELTIMVPECIGLPFYDNLLNNKNITIIRKKINDYVQESER